MKYQHTRLPTLKLRNSITGNILEITYKLADTTNYVVGVLAVNLGEMLNQRFNIATGNNDNKSSSTNKKNRKRPKTLQKGKSMSKSGMLCCFLYFSSFSTVKTQETNFYCNTEVNNAYYPCYMKFDTNHGYVGNMQYHDINFDFYFNKDYKECEGNNKMLDLVLLFLQNSKNILISITNSSALSSFSFISKNNRHITDKTPCKIGCKSRFRKTYLPVAQQYQPNFVDMYACPPVFDVKDVDAKVQMLCVTKGKIRDDYVSWIQINDKGRFRELASEKYSVTKKHLPKLCRRKDRYYLSMLYGEDKPNFNTPYTCQIGGSRNATVDLTKWYHAMHVTANLPCTNGTITKAEIRKPTTPKVIVTPLANKSKVMTTPLTGELNTDIVTISKTHPEPTTNKETDRKNYVKWSVPLTISILVMLAATIAILARRKKVCVTKNNEPSLIELEDLPLSGNVGEQIEGPESSLNNATCPPNATRATPQERITLM